MKQLKKNTWVWGILWKREPDAIRGFSGKWEIFKVEKPASCQYKVECFLPIPMNETSFRTEYGALHAAQKTYEKFCTYAKLSPKGETLAVQKKRLQKKIGEQSKAV